jgi:succinate dehydrogenase / fumarate reductase cytochrome b subunit
MALAGLFWFAYLIFHLLGLLNFHIGEEAFNSYYGWLNNSPIDIVIRVLLFLSIGFHVYIAVARQISNNSSLGDKYKKPYPKAIPRVVAWSGALIILFFIIFHYFQIHEVEHVMLYKFLFETILKPEILIIYILGLITITAHLHHGLTNVFQSLGLCSKQYNIVVIFILLVVMSGYISIPLSIWYV